DPDYARTWTAFLNRMNMWRTLGEAYWATGDEKYAREFVDQMTDFIEDQPAPVFGSPSQFPCWLTIQQGIRTSGSWMDAFHYFLGSPSMTPEAMTMFLKSFVEHARLLTRMALENPQHGGNWVTMEMNGLAHIGVMFPEFKEAEHWRDVAYSRMLEELDKQVYPDGAQKELSTGYHQVARRNFIAALEPARLNGVDIPDDYMDRLKKMYWYNLRCMKPNGQLPALNDSGNTRVRDSLMEAYEIWGDEEFLWGATLGGDGEPVDFTSWFFPWAGQCVMRSGWGRNDKYMMFEIGPYGIGHQHEDKLGLTLYAYGRQLLTEAGTYKYDQSKWRRYALTTPSHNSVLVDGLSQHRYARRELYEADEPLTGHWAHTETFDWAFGRYEDGYGERGTPVDELLLQVQHERSIIFVRPDYFVVIDRLQSEDDAEHTYSNLFHFDAETAEVDQDTLVARSTEEGMPNVTLVPLATDGLSARIVRGQEDPLQGWIPRRGFRKIPTAIYEKTSADDVIFITLIVPHPDNEKVPIHAVSEHDKDTIALTVRTSESTDRILYALDNAAEMAGAGIEATCKAAVVRQPELGDMRIGVLDGTDIDVAEAMSSIQNIK
ncbi:MAG: alginate lyase family protein, partial [Armatimonadota bacterium]